MATYSPDSLGIKAPAGGFQEGGWYSGRQYIGGTLSDPGVIHPQSSQTGAGQAVSKEVNAQSAQQQGVTSQQLESYLDQQRRLQTQQNVQPTATTSPAYSGTAGVAGSTGSGVGYQAPETINLAETYKGLVQGSGIQEKQTELANMDRAFTEAKAEINDNPYLSEATRVGRVAKLETQHAERTKNLRDEIATKQADAETQLNLQLKQFDINSQQANQALEQFNFLLSSGALDNASGEDIANLTRSTGISSSMIYSAIESNKKKNVETQLIKSEDDNGVVTVTTVDQYGNVLNQTSLGAIGNKQGGSTSSGQKQQELQAKMVSALESVKNSYGHVSPGDWQGALASWIARGGNREDFISNFQQYTDPNRGDFDQVYFQRY